MGVLGLTAAWADFFTVGGFVVAVIGFGYTIYQVRKAKSAAEAAREATTEVRSRVRAVFWQQLLAQILRMISEVRREVQLARWEAASIRTNDLADLLVELQSLREQLQDLINRLREFAQDMAEKANRPSRRFSLTNWNEFLLGLQREIDRLRGPSILGEHDDY